jgi:hypothetical protein
MTEVGFEPRIPVFEGALDRAATAIALVRSYSTKFQVQTNPKYRVTYR